MQNVGNEEAPKDFGTRLLDEVLSLGRLETYKTGLDELMRSSDALNATFLQGRGRIEQMQLAVADAIPGIIRAGGEIKDVVATMGDVALAVRRNLIASEETVSELYSSSELIDRTVRTITENFTSVGILVDDIGEKIEESILYVQSIGLNAKEIMQAVVDNTDQLNRFQFEGGVKGLTKMAAQASMLRVDMQQTFNFADKVLDPEGAIEVAAAFQRLGVAAGTLVDPFQMMNQSILDPSGLQTSLAKVAKSFVSFSRETNSFRINPEGVLRLREMEEAASLSRGTLSKMGIAAAEMGERMKQVSAAGLKFKNEEDKQFLANITSMGEGGVFQVTLEDGTKVDISKLQQEQFDKLIAREKDRPKTVEDIARSQLSVSQLIEKDVRALTSKIVYGTVSMGPIPGLTEDLRGLGMAFGAGLSMEGKERVTAADIRGTLNSVSQELADTLKGPGDLMDKLKNFENVAADKLGNVDDKLVDYLKRFVVNAESQLRGSRENEAFLKDAIQKEFQSAFVNPIQEGMKNYRTGQAFIEGTQPLTATQSYSKNQTTQLGTTTQVLKGNIDLNVNHKFPPEFEKLSNSDQLKIFDQYLKDEMKKQSFQNYFYDLMDKRKSSLTKRE